jgi:hypothetical protein
MHGRKLGAGLMVFASSLLLLAGSASAHGAAGPQVAEGTGSCKIKSLPSFIAQGEFGTAASVADVIEVSCNPSEYGTGAAITIIASQLYSRCGSSMTWYDANDNGEYTHSWGRSFDVHLDVNGNANVALIAGPNCMVGESLISVDETESPYETFTESFQVLPTTNTTPGLFITPSSQVEDATSSGVITIAQAEFKNAAEANVRLGYEQLTDRCARSGSDHSVLVKANREEFSNYEEVNPGIELDNNSNGFAVLVGTDSCQEGLSLIEADLEESPFTTQTAQFNVEAPRQRF